MSRFDIREHPIGTTRGHATQGPRDVQGFTLEAGDGFAATVWSYGATLVDFSYPDRGGRMHNLVQRLPDLSSYEDRSRNPYLGATMGRYARVIANGRFELNGQKFDVTRNIGAHHFHGGSIGFDRLVWQPRPEQTADSVGVRFELVSPEGDQGYPGELRATTWYRLFADGRLSLEYQATTTRSTVVAMTNHANWNLAGHSTIDNHSLRIRASRVLLVDSDLIPTQPQNVALAQLDFRQLRRIGPTRLDHTFIVDEPLAALELYESHSGRLLELSTDHSGLQVYSGEVLPQRRSGLCIQTGAWPNSPNRADFPSSRLDPGATYRHQTTLRFSIR